MSGSGLIRTSPTGPMPSTGCSVSSMVIAIIAVVWPMPLAIRSGRNRRAADLPRITPPWSAYRNRVSSRPSLVALSTAAEMVAGLSEDVMHQG